ncbi:hypothetical protein RhiirA5_434440 [Rhizophagus irregularis]|uniref:Uncharacterized protein n=1 Tax=Rhizophagus irregularis TaxID=588596 RepID=A0A2N0NQ39_9GLOM|nr:hypothetical protein RhiirA5_434440 [Rhizophagus irregularis]
MSLSIDYFCKINEGLDAKFYQKILDKDFIETLDYYELDARNIIFIQNNDSKHTAIFKFQQGFGSFDIYNKFHQVSLFSSVSPTF